MAKRISATEAVRNFSELLTRIRFQREQYTILRGGKPIAELGPAGARTPRMLGELPDLLKQLPSLGDDAEAFRRDVERAARKAPGLPRRPAWG